MPAMQLTNDGIKVLVDADNGGRIASLRFGRTEVLVTTAINPLTWGIYPMVPYAGRVRHARLRHGGVEHVLRMNSESHSLHGTVFDRRWTVTHAAPSSMEMEVDLGPHWPFSGMVTHSISVQPESLTCVLSVDAEESMPVQVGWHPWFRRPSTTQISFGAMLRRDEEGIATDEIVDVPSRPVDDCFVEAEMNPRVKIKDVLLEVSSDCSHWVVYDAPSGDVCIEPQSGPPNGVNSHPFVIEPGNRFTRTMTIRRVG